MKCKYEQVLGIKFAVYMSGAAGVYNNIYIYIYIYLEKDEAIFMM